MYHYNFTNDLRISNLDNTLKDAAHAFLTDTVPSPTVDKSKNNNFMTVGFYFNLKAKGICAKLAESGNIKKVVLNFIKKFQFPNVRTPSDYENTISDGIKLAPMREIVKFLNALSLIDKNEAYLTKEEIQYFIFFNESIAKKENPNILEAISQLINYRKTKQLPQNINTNENEHFWNQPERQIREMIKTLKYTGCFLDVDENTIKLDVKNISRDSKADLFEIINFDSYWTGKTVEDWQKYMDEGLEIENNEINIIKTSTSSTQTPTQIIFYGVPGSGKSHSIKKELSAKGIKDLKEQTKRVVFHPEYTNADFVGQILPQSYNNGERISYPFVPGPFTQILAKAYTHKNRHYALIIEEINRGNAAAIFGELFQLLDRLDEDETESSNEVAYTKGWSSYSINNDNINKSIQEVYENFKSDSNFEPFINKEIFDTYKLNIGIRLPPNLSIFATMNTSDQNVFKLDNAFKRRWELRLIPNKFKEEQEEINQRDAVVESFDFTWNNFREAVNSIIIAPDNSIDISSFADRQIGCWFTKAIKKDEKYIIEKEVFVHKVLEYLWDDVCNGDIGIFFNENYKSFAELVEDVIEKKSTDIFSENLKVKLSQNKPE